MVDTAAPAPKKSSAFNDLMDKVQKASTSLKPKAVSAPTQTITRTYAAAPAQKSLISKKFILIMVLVLVIGISALAIYIKITLNNIINNSNAHPVTLPRPSIKTSLQGQELLNYYNDKYYIPFGLINYESSNVSNIDVNVSLYNYTPPSLIYVLNVSDECWQDFCGNTTGIIYNMERYLIKYNVIQGPENITLISPSNVRDLPPDSILIVMDGLLPSDFLEQVGQNTTVLDHLLQEHTSIIYIGGNFSTVVTHHGVAEPIEQALPTGFQFPNYLHTIPRTLSTSQKKIPSEFYFNSTSYEFYEGTNYSSLNYEDVYNGSIVLFSSTPLAGWSNSREEGHDLAKTIQELFWLPRAAYGNRKIGLNSTKNSSGQIGVLLNATKIPSNTNYVNNANNGTLRVWVTANGTYYPYISNSTYQYFEAKPYFYDNGSIGINPSIVMNLSTTINFTLISGSKAPTKISFPFIELYDMNMTPVFTTPLPALTNVSGNYTFYDSQIFFLAPGRGYIMKMFNSAHQYSAAYFTIAPFNLSLYAANFSSDRFIFHVNSDKATINGINYTMTLDGAYPETGVIINNFLNYSTPEHTPTLHGALNFSLDVLGGKSYITEYYYILPFGISPQYIEIGVVMVMMLVMILFVRAPHRDEFYIDVPNLPEEKKTDVILKARDIVGVFDKLNISYRWKYMPLSKAEIRSAISANIRVNNIPVGLTYANVEKILDQLVAKKELVTADDLYAPTDWIEKSKHDIEYLATFKKLRLYLVTHAYIFTDLDTSTSSDIVATLHSERKYIVIYSKTSKFGKVPIYAGSATYIAFINSYKLEEFKNTLYNSTSAEAEELKMYISADMVKLMDSDNPEGLST